MTFLSDQQLLIDNVFLWRAQPCKIRFSGITETVSGIFRDPAAEQQLGELVVGTSNPTLRVKTADIATMNVERESLVDVPSTGKTYTVKKVDPADDGTTYLTLGR